MAAPNCSNLPQNIHRQIVNGILNDWPEARETGFFKALRSLPDADYVTEMLANDPQWVAWVRFTPDVWLINAEERHVVIYEAVNTNDVSEIKFAKMADLSWALDEDYYRLILVRCDRFGRRAYDIQTASLVHSIQSTKGGARPENYRVPDWQKFDVQYCEAFFARAA